MKIKKILALVLSLSLATAAVAVPVFAADAPLRSIMWSNTAEVQISHSHIDGYACCEIYIEGYSGTDKIDNVNITLSRVSGSNLIEVKSWTGLSAEGEKFKFYDEVENVPKGYTYRLSVTADVHRNGTVESLDNQYHDVRY